MKKVLIVVGVIVALLLIVIIVLPFVIDVNRFKPTLETDLTNALSRKVEIGNIELSVLSGGVKVDSVSIADDPAFSQSPFLQAKQLTAGVALLPLIFSQKLEVSSFTITEPHVQLLHSPSGVWNFSSLGGGASKSAPKSSASSSSSAPTSDPPSSSSSSATAISVEKLKISNGTIVVGTTGAHGKTQTYQEVNLEASNLSYTSQFPFKMTAKTPGGGSVDLEGNAGPINPTDSSLTPLNAKIDVENLDLASTGFVDASSGFAGLITFNGNLTSDGKSMNSNGTVKASKLKLVAGGSPATVPVNVDYTTNYDLKRQGGTLSQGDVHIGKALAHLTGSYDMAGATTSVQMKLNGQGMPVPDLEGVLPAAGVNLPSGASLQSGTLNLNLGISGPVDKLVIAGPVNLSNAKLAGYNLKSKLGALSSFSGLGGGSSGSDTDIQTLSADIRQDPSGTQANNINLVAPSIGTVTGNGTVSPAGALNCKMVAKLAAGNAVGSMTSTLSSFTGGGKSSSGGGIPFTITGTTSNPVFLPDIKGMAGNLIKGGAGTSGSAASQVQGALGGLFGKKKTP